MQSYKRRNIGTILIDRGSLAPEKLSAVVEQLTTTKLRFGEICVHEGFVSDEQVALALSEQFNLNYVDLSDFKMSEEILNALPPEAIYRFHFVPLEMGGANDTSNYLTACRKCNKDKGGMAPADWIAYKKPVWPPHVLTVEWYVQYLAQRTLP